MIFKLVAYNPEDTSVALANMPFAIQDDHLDDMPAVEMLLVMAYEGLREFMAENDLGKQAVSS